MGGQPGDLEIENNGFPLSDEVDTCEEQLSQVGICKELFADTGNEEDQFCYQQDTFSNSFV
jgi:hypothetical protein